MVDVVTRVLDKPVPARVRLISEAGGRCRAELSIGETFRRVFMAETPFPEVASQATKELMKTGRIALDWTGGKFRLVPQGLGGGCVCPSRPRPPDLPMTKKTSEFEEIYAGAYPPGSDYRNVFVPLLKEANYNFSFFSSNLTYLCSRTDFSSPLDKEAIFFLKKLFNFVFLSVTKAGRCIPQVQAQSCCDQIQGYLVASRQLSNVLKTTLQLMKTGLLELAQPTLVTSEEVKSGLSVAYEVLLGQREALSKGLALNNVFFGKSDFLTSLAVEIAFKLSQGGEYTDLKYVFVVLNAAVQRGDEFALYLVNEVSRYFEQVSGWVPAYSPLLEGEHGNKGLCAFALNAANPELQQASKEVLENLQHSPVPEFRDVAVKTLGVVNKPVPEFLFAPVPKESAAVLADVATNSFRKVANEHFHSKSRATFTNTNIIVITGVPIEGENKGCIKFNLETGDFALLPALLSPRYWHSAAFFQGQVYVTGGKVSKNEPSLRSVETLLGNEKEWVNCKSMNYGRDSHSSCVVGEALYVLGSTNPATSIEKYSDSVWTLIPTQLPQPTLLCAVCALDDHTLLVAGGRCTSPKLTYTIDFSSGVRNPLSDLPRESVFVPGMYKMIRGELHIITEENILFKLEIGDKESQWRELGRYQESA